MVDVALATIDLCEPKESFAKPTLIFQGWARPFVPRYRFTIQIFSPVSLSRDTFYSDFNCKLFSPPAYS